jgi:hypothetical protein
MRAAGGAISGEGAFLAVQVSAIFADAAEAIRGRDIEKVDLGSLGLVQNNPAYYQSFDWNHCTYSRK